MVEASLSESATPHPASEALTPLSQDALFLLAAASTTK
jgi:hypothetical protein